ncbi:unnamed protein product [Callosobruchus maculatus]|uniref:Uncharacterized protein n=1 Tax=Callosobruchus maculatus TaxID=64391 RepID=A0A653BQC6_CALMS|nr:unnamed protein product [Callosobruchus maculatus]
MSRCQTSESAFCAGSSVADSTTSTKVGYQRPYIALLTETEYLDFSYKCKALIILHLKKNLEQLNLSNVSNRSTSNKHLTCETGTSRKELLVDGEPACGEVEYEVRIGDINSSRGAPNVLVIGEELARDVSRLLYPCKIY